MIRTRISEALHAAFLEHAGLSHPLLASILTAAAIDRWMPAQGRDYLVSIPGLDCAREFKGVLESWESTARIIGDTERLMDCRDALKDLRIAVAARFYEETRVTASGSTGLVVI